MWACWVLALLVFSGCSDPDHALSRWRLGGGAELDLPGHVPVDDRDQTYVLEARDVLPPALRGRELDFVIPRLWANTALWVDGRPAVRLGEVDGGGYRTTTPHVYRIPQAASADGVLALRLFVNHRWTQSAWVDVAPRLVPAGRQDAAARASALVNGPLSIFAIATLLQIGFAALLVYFVGGKRRVYLWFGIQAVCAAVYPAFVVGVTQSLFGREFDVLVTALGLILAVWASVYFSYAFFELGRVPAWIDALMVVACAVTVGGYRPYHSTRLGGSAAIGIVALAVVLQCTLCARMTLVPARRLEARWYLACWVALAATCWNEMFTWSGLGDALSGPRAACLGLMGFAFFLSLLLSQRHMSALGQSDRLNLELEARVTDLERRGHEIAELNAELRRQIGERSEQIYAALSLRDRPEGTVPKLAPGELVQQRYRTLRLCGMGGMGAVYEVERLRDGMHLALKLTREASGFALARLAREAQIAAQLAHPNVVRVVDVDIASTLGVLYIVMELVEGKSLAELGHNHGKQSWALTVLAQVASGLSVLHDAGIVHRDIKPANILVVDPDDERVLCVKITDFGIAKQNATESIAPDAPEPVEPTAPIRTRKPPSEDATELLQGANGDDTDAMAQGTFTRAGVIPGTPTYMAPELMQTGGTATRAADMYSFGVLAYELLTGSRPFVRPQVLAMLSGEELEVPPKLSERGAHLAPSLAAALEGCLAIRPESRPSASQLMTLLSSARS